MITHIFNRALATAISVAFMMAIIPSFAEAVPIREVTDRSSSGDLGTTSTVNLKYTRTTDSTLLCQSYLLIEPPNAVATMLVFVGGGGRLGIADGGIGVRSTNFLFRNRYHFAAAGPFNVAVIDAPFEGLANTSDECSGRGSDLTRLMTSFRLSERHLEDIETVIADLRTNVSGSLPIYVNGTSAGTLSAASAAAFLSGPNAPKKMILTGSLTQIDPPSRDLGDVPLEQISIPSLVASHRDDGCPTNRPEDVKVLKERLKAGGAAVQNRLFVGGPAPLSDECGSLSQHGFLGIEPKVVKFISDWAR